MSVQVIMEDVITHVPTHKDPFTVPVNMVTH